MPTEEEGYFMGWDDCLDNLINTIQGDLDNLKENLPEYFHSLLESNVIDGADDHDFIIMGKVLQSIIIYLKEESEKHNDVQRFNE